MSMTSRFVKDKHVILYVFDLSNRKSFLSIKDWLKWSKNFRLKNALSVLVGTKADLESEELISSQ